MNKKTMMIIGSVASFIIGFFVLGYINFFTKSLISNFIYENITDSKTAEILFNINIFIVNGILGLSIFFNLVLFIERKRMYDPEQARQRKVEKLEKKINKLKK